MSNKFINAMTEDASFSKTTNGMTCRSTTGSYLLDFLPVWGHFVRVTKMQLVPYFIRHLTKIPNSR